MTESEFLDRLRNLRVEIRGDWRAPHKPLLLLYALGQCHRGNDRLQTFKEVEPVLVDLLQRFGTYRETPSPKDPFWRLPRDGVWELRDQEGQQVIPKGSKKPEVKWLRGVEGGFSEEVFDLFRSDPGVVKRAADLLLESEFEESYHDDILEAVGLEGRFEGMHGDRKRAPRDPAFRARVIQAYEYRCAVCNYDICIDKYLLGVEAAHIRWHARGGPDEVSNGLALCALHHQALDRGGISLRDDLTLLVSPQLHGSLAADSWFLRFRNRPVRKPREQAERPDPLHLDWHRKQVYRPKAE